MSLSIIGRQTYVNTNYNIQVDDENLLFTTREGAVNSYLPSLETLPKGYGFRMKDESGQAASFPITFHGDGAEEIQGSSTYVMNLNYAQVDIVSAGDKWITLSSHNPTLTPISEGGTGARTAVQAVQNLGIEIRDPVRVAAKTNIDMLSLPTEVNGVTLADGDDVLLWLQTSPEENGVYHVVDAAGGIWERRSDFNESSDFTLGLQVLVLEGNSYAGVYFVNNTVDPVIGTDPISFTPLNDATAVYDAYGNKVFGYEYVANAENYIRAENTVAGTSPRLRGWSDTETHVGGSLETKGNGRWHGLQLIEVNDTTDITTAGDVTYSVYAACGSFITRDPNGANRTDTLPTAADIIAHIPDCFPKMSFRLSVVNTADADETITLVGNTGINLVGNGEIRQGETKQFLLYVNDTAAMGVSDSMTAYEIGTPYSVPTELHDSLGAVAVSTEAAPTSVNYLLAKNASTGTSVELRADGSDANIPLRLGTKGQAAIYAESPILSACTVESENTAGDVVYSAPKMISNIFDRDPNGAARADTTDTAANIVSVLVDLESDTGWFFTIRNTGAPLEDITLSGGTGVTISGTATITPGSSRTFLVLVTDTTPSSEAVTMYSIGTSTF